MKVALFIPCYVDAFFPKWASPRSSCSSGSASKLPILSIRPAVASRWPTAAVTKKRRRPKGFREELAGFDYVVGPSGSCVHHIRENLTAIAQTAEVRKVRTNTFELVEFLHDVVKVQAFPWAEFRHKVGLHNGCATLRGLREAKSTEIDEPNFSKPMDLLSKVKGIEFVKPRRPDECCGFGGTFSVFEEPVSARMGNDKVNDHQRAGAEYIVSADMSCVMHQKGCAERLGLPIKFMHFAQVINGDRA
jgi:L-lactate dehydrogenase complex protein LldE